LSATVATAKAKATSCCIYEILLSFGFNANTQGKKRAQEGDRPSQKALFGSNIVRDRVTTLTNPLPPNHFPPTSN